MSKKRQKEKSDKSNVDDDASKNAGHCENTPVQTFDEYRCSGNVEMDFPGLCAVLDVTDIPAVSTKTPASNSEPEEEQTDEDSQVNPAPFWSKRCLQVELENEDPISARKLVVTGWKVSEEIARVLQKMLPSLSKLRSLQFWQAGLTEQMVISFMNAVSLCANIRSVTLEGNPLPEQSFHLLLSEDGPLTQLSLRNNRIGDEGASLIGSALSTAKQLLSLNLAFNSIGDAGAKHIAQGLRLNRTLLSLSLSNNQIGDSGAASLAAILGELVLTHEEVVQRRKLLLEIMPSSLFGSESEHSPASLSSITSSTSQSEQSPASLSSTSISNKIKKKATSKKEEKPAAGRENPRSNKKPSDVKMHQTKGGKLGDKEKQLAMQEEDDITAVCHEQVEGGGSPLLAPGVQYREGELVLPGNATLASLNLAGNRITAKALPLILTSLEAQADGGGLLHLCLQRNLFSSECETYLQIKEAMSHRDPLQKTNSNQKEEEADN